MKQQKYHKNDIIGTSSSGTDITVRSKAEDARQHSKDRMYVLHLFAVELGYAESIDDIVKTTFHIMRDVLGFQFSSFQLLENEKLITVDTDGHPSLDLVFSLSGKGITTRAAREAKTQLIADVRDDPDFIQAATESLSELAVPIIGKDRVLGVLNVESLELDAFNEEDKILLELLANNVASALYQIEQTKIMKQIQQDHELDLIKSFQRFSSMVRHDLKTPLMNVNNALDLVNENPDMSEQLFEMIQRNLSNANKIMEDWKQKTYSNKINLTHVNLAQLVSESLDAMLISETINVEVDIKKDLNVILDNTAMLRLFTNLFKNAIEAMPEGGLLTVKMQKEDNSLKIFISDTGSGMSKETLSKIFTPFYSTKANGMGLGLPYCKQVIDAHNGLITVDSEENKGTSFTIILPIKKRMED